MQPAFAQRSAGSAFAPQLQSFHDRAGSPTSCRRRRAVLDTQIDELQKRRVPCLVAYLTPFRIISAPGKGDWEPTIEDINNRAWDYQALHELIGGVDVGLEAPAHLVIARDGALALPPMGKLLEHQNAVAFYNHCLAALLLGGIYCEAVSSDGLEIGSIIDWKYVRASGSGRAAANRLHNNVRRRQSSPMEAISLFRPSILELKEITEAMAVGLSALNRVDTLRGEYLLKGTTAIARRDWGDALANLWIVVEQLIAVLWTGSIVAPTLEIDGSKARRAQLDDTRTWTASARIELLFQKGVVDQELVSCLNEARRARNTLAHEGKAPQQGSAKAAYAGVCGLLRVALHGETLPLFDIDLDDHQMSDPLSPPRILPGEPEFWMEIPKLPGEAELEKQEAIAYQSRQSASV